MIIYSYYCVDLMIFTYAFTIYFGDFLGYFKLRGAEGVQETEAREVFRLLDAQGEGRVACRQPREEERSVVWQEMGAGAERKKIETALGAGSEEERAEEEALGSWRSRG